MNDLVRLIGALAGGTIILVTLASLVQTFVVPRTGGSGLLRLTARSTGLLLRVLIRPIRTYAGKDHVLAWWGPLTLLLLLAVYLALFHLGWSLVLWPTIPEAGFFLAAREAGSSLYTLGFATTARPGPTVIDFLTAGTGLLTIALLIAYLPVLYAAFSRRETLVTVLQSRAGSPAWGPEILARHASVGLMGNLRTLYADWEIWAAEVAESHTNYPMLVGFRSPHPLRSWVIGLLAVLDAAALQLALDPDDAPPEARLCLRMGFTCLRDIADALNMPYDPDPDPDQPILLTREAYDRGIARLAGVDFPSSRTPDEAWPHFRGWRVNYEQVAYALADRINAPPAPWSGSRARLTGTVIEPIRPVDRRPGGETHRFEVPTIDD